MKHLGCVFSIIGLLCFSLCLWIFGSYIAQKVATLTGDTAIPDQTMVSHSTSLVINQRLVISELKVKQGQYAQLAVGLLFKQKIKEQSFSYNYQVLNQRGQKIFIDQGDFSTFQSKTPVKEQWIDKQQALEFYLGSFPLPDSRVIEIRFTLTGEGDSLDKSQLRVYALEESSSSMSLSTGIVLLALSCGLTVVGVFLFIVGKTEEMEEVLS